MLLPKKGIPTIKNDHIFLNILILSFFIEKIKWMNQAYGFLLPFNIGEYLKAYILFLRIFKSDDNQ